MMSRSLSLPHVQFVIVNHWTAHMTVMEFTFVQCLRVGLGDGKGEAVERKATKI